jgi:hypothetical protein
MWADEAWRILGLEPCDDARAVKRAYAQKLKAIDPDHDIAGFDRLRQAMASAQADAHWRASADYTEQQNPDNDDWDEDWEHDWDADDDAASVPYYGALTVTPHMAFQQDQAVRGRAKPDFSPFGESDGDHPSTSPKAKYSTADFSAFDDSQGGGNSSQNDDRDPFHELASALSDSTTVWNNEATFTHLLRQILDDPRMQNVDFARQSETWLATLLRQTRPKSDPLIMMAYAHFGWQNRLDSLKASEPEYFAAQAGFDLLAEQALRNPRHEWHDAYARLTMENPPPISFKDQLQLGRQMERLISSLNNHNPALLYNIDPDNIAKWQAAGFVDEKSDTRSSGNMSIYVMIWITFFALWVMIKIIFLIQGSA